MHAFRERIAKNNVEENKCLHFRREQPKITLNVNLREHSLYIKGNTHKMSRKANNPYKKCDPWEKEKQI